MNCQSLMSKSWRAIIVFMALFFSFMTNETSAQLRYGFRFGGNFEDVRLKGTDVYSIVNRSGFTGGLMLEYQMPTCGFAPDVAIVYSRRNVNVIDAISDEPFSPGKNYLEVPLHLKYKFPIKAIKELVSPMIYTGPSLGFKLGAGDIPDFKTRKFEAGWDVGVGIDIVNFIQIEGGYTFGMTNGLANNLNDVMLHMNRWTLCVNLLFDF